MLIEIKNDVFFIASRLKEIDSNYYILFNTDRNVYEIHHRKQKESYAFTVPYEKLDARTVEWTHKTKVENRKKLIEEIDKENEKIEKERFNKALDHAGELIEKNLCLRRKYGN